MTLTQISSRGVEDTLRWSLGASGTTAYTFTGPGLAGTVNNPTIYLSRGQTYIFENNSGGHPFQIQSVAGVGGAAYNTGVTNNGGGNGTEIIITVAHDAPDNLYYQCTSHSGMNGIIFVTGAVAAGSITETKLANDAVTSDKIAANPVLTGTSGVKLPEGTTAQRVNTEGVLRYNTELNLPEYYNGTAWIAIDTPPSVTSVTPTEVASAAGGNITFTINGAVFNTGVTVKFVSNNGTELTPSTVTRVSSGQVTAVIAKSDFVNAQEPYDVKVTNTSGLSATLSDQINVDNEPAWVTSSGSLGTFNNAETVNVSVSATDADGDTVAYAIQSGSLPTGLSLNSGTGAITGTIGSVSSSTTYNFTIRATANSKTADRAFTMVNDGPNIVAFSYTGSAQTWTRPAGVTSITAYVWGGGGGGGAPGWGDLSQQWYGVAGESGGAGGYGSAVIDVTNYSSLTIAVAGGGDGGSNGDSTWEGGAGGGLSGIFDSNGTGNQSYAIVIAGGGGGGSGLSYVGSGGGGGGGFGQNGQDAQDNQHRSGTGGHGGTQSSGGSAGSHADSAQYKYHSGQGGGALYGGRNPATHSGNTIRSETPAYLGGGEAYTSTTGWNPGGSGGGGYFGGGAGDTGYGAGAGGGSGYAKSSVTSSVTGTTGTNGGTSSVTIAAPEASSTYYATGIAEGGSPSMHGGNGRIVLVY